MIFEKLHMTAFAALAEWQSEGGAVQLSRENAEAIWQATLYLFYNEGADPDKAATLYFRTEKGGRFSLARQGEGEAILSDLETGDVQRLAKPGELLFGVPLSVFCARARIAPKEKNAFYGERVTEAGRRALLYGREDLDAESAEAALVTVKEEIFGVREGEGALAKLEEKRRKTEAACQSALAESALRLQEENQALRLKKKIEDAEAEHEKFRRLISDFHEAETIAAFDELHEEERRAEKKAEELRLCISDNTYGGFCPDAGYLFDLISAKNRLDKAVAAHKERGATVAEVYALPPAVTQEERNVLSLLEKAGMEKAGDNVRLLSKRKNVLMVFGSLLLAAVLASLVLTIVLFALQSTSTAFLALIGLLLLTGAAGALWYEAYKTFKQKRAICQFCLANDADGLALRIREARDVLARIARRRDRLFGVECDFYRAAEELAAAREGFAVLAAKYGYEAMGENYGEIFSALSARVDEYLKKVSALQAEKEFIDNKVRNMRYRLAGIGEVAVRARLSPPDRVRLRKLKESDLLQGAAYYQRQMEELREKEKQLTVNLYSELSEREAAERAADAMAMKEREAALAARGAAAEEAARILRRGTDALASRQAERKAAALRYAKDENDATGLLVGTALSAVDTLFLEKPPLFFTDGKDGAYRYAAEKWGEAGQAIVFA